MSHWTKLPPIEGGHGGCLHCGYQHETLPWHAVIAVGFGMAYVTKDGQPDGQPVYSEDEAQTDEELWTCADAEEAALQDPDHDWRISLVAPLSERHYQRQGVGHWVLYEKAGGFA